MRSDVRLNEFSSRELFSIVSNESSDWAQWARIRMASLSECRSKSAKYLSTIIYFTLGKMSRSVVEVTTTGSVSVVRPTLCGCFLFAGSFDLDLRRTLCTVC